MVKSLSIGLVCGLLSFSAIAFELDPNLNAEQQGLAIAVESDERDEGWGDVTAEMQMTLIDRKGRRSERKLRIKNLEVEGDGDKALTIFDAPRDVKGTAFLSFTHALEPDDQWLFLSALNKVKRISSENKSGPFMGSEFAFEDLSSFEIEKFRYEYIGSEVFEGTDCYVNKLFPQYSHSGYTYQIVWLDKQEFRPRKVEFYDRKNKLLKTQVLEGYQQYMNKYWRPHRIYMENHQTGKSTELLWSNYQFGTGLTHKDFNKRRLQNIQ